MIRGLALVALLLAPIGCGQSPDPASSRLAPGASAVLVGGKEVPIRMPGGDAEELGVGLLAPGTSVSVDADDAGPDVRADEDDGADPRARVDHRWVRVTVADGPHKGRVGQAQRFRLRPAPR